MDAALQFVSGGLQALLDLLGDASPDKLLRVGTLRRLIEPMADQADQAANVAERLVADDPGAPDLIP